MDVSNFNESDVREEILAPLLRSLGYAKGTSNDILREQDLRLKYPFIFLGRKKPGRDPEIRGRADYILNVVGAARWVLEAKPPSDPIAGDEIDQAFSYARHPEVNAEIIAICNGRIFVAYSARDRADDSPLFSTDDCSHDNLLNKLRNFLSPEAIRRDFKPILVDAGNTLGGALRSYEEIRGGTTLHTMAAWDINDCPPQARNTLDTQLVDSIKYVEGLNSAISGGHVSRLDDGRITARVDFIPPYAQLRDLFSSVKLDELRYVCLDEKISNNMDAPSTFDYFFESHLHHGQRFYDLATHDIQLVHFPARMTLRGQAIGYLSGRDFIGRFQTENDIFMNAMGTRIDLTFYTAGEFKILL